MTTLAILSAVGTTFCRNSNRFAAIGVESTLTPVMSRAQTFLLTFSSGRALGGERDGGSVPTAVLRTYVCRPCKEYVDVDNGVALWQVLHDARKESGEK